jgi:hypothetical protein
MREAESLARRPSEHMAIDDQLDATHAAYPDEPRSILAAVLKLSGPFAAWVSLANKLQEVFSPDSTAQRVKALLTVIEGYVRKHEREINKIIQRIESPGFIEAMLKGVSETSRTANLNKVERFARVLGNSLCREKGDPDWEEAAAFIRDLAELTEDDLTALQILNQVMGDLFAPYPRQYPPDEFARRNNDLKGEVNRRGIIPDEFHARCSRLTGFGLAIQVMFIASSMSPGDYCFRPTDRGRRLLTLLE